MANMQFDSLIFDMDGTLWDVVDSYCHIWDMTHKQCNIEHKPVTRDELIKLMGSTIEKIIETLTPQAIDNDKFLHSLDYNEKAMMPILGGKLYPGVKELIPLIAKSHKLFMVSNCSAHGLTNFLNFTGLAPYMTDALSYGETMVGKDTNIKAIIDKYDLKSPLYVGDTQGDADSCKKAGVPIAWAAYGFGNVTAPDYTIHCFNDIMTIAI